MPVAKLPPELTTRLLEEGMGPTAVSRYLKEHMGIEASPSAVSMFRKRYTDVPSQPGTSRERVIPWTIASEHRTSRYRYAILAWHQREKDHPLADERYRNLLKVEADLKENGRVIDYSPTNGFFERPAREGVDVGIVREVDGVPRPATRGPYAVASQN